MNRPISLSNLINIIKLIKRNRPDIIIWTELICGFPTETIDDLKRSIELVQELDILTTTFHPYVDSKQIPSTKLKQHTFDYNLACSEYVEEKLMAQYSKCENQVLSGEMLVIEKNKDYYTVMLVNGAIIRFRFDQFNREYSVNDLIPANTIIPKQVAKRRTRIKQKKNN